jgi:hypothetical protein
MSHIYDTMTEQMEKLMNAHIPLSVIQTLLARTHGYMVVQYVVNDDNLLSQPRILGMYKSHYPAYCMVNSLYKDVQWSKNKCKFNLIRESDDKVVYGEITQSTVSHTGSHVYDFYKSSI